MKKQGYLVFIVAILALFVFRECEHRSEKKMLAKSMKSQEEFFKKEMDSYFAGMKLEVEDVKNTTQNIVSSIDEIEAIKDLYPEFKNIESIVKTELHTNISGSLAFTPPDTIFVPVTTEGMVHIDSINKYYIPRGSKASHDELWYDIAITLNDSLQIDSLRVRDKIDAVLAWKKPDKNFKFLRKRIPVVSVQSYNPYTDIGYVNNLVVKDERSKFAKVLTSKPMMFLYGVGSVFVYQGLK